jgi:flagellar assembly protein FliH
MSSRILDPGAPIEPMPWRPAGSPPPQPNPSRASREDPGGGGNPSPLNAQPYSAGSAERSHDSVEQTRIRELEGSLKLLERRLEDERKSARDQGHQQGLAAGAQQEASKWTDALGRLGRSLEDMSKSKARFRAEVEEDAVRLALAIARKILNREMASDPEALVGLARVALGKLNLRELQRVRVHPSDAAAVERLVTASSGPKRVEVVADNTLERGAALFETDRGTLDASVSTQLREIERGLADMIGGLPK